MPLQNRVSPFGTIEATNARGLFTGNRGIIHDPDTRTLLTRRWSTKAWIICDCNFREVRREVMGRNSRTGGAGWTELFFLDEVTALAAGHRPCFHCRPQQARAFARCFAAGQGRERMRAAEIDAVLHRDRRASGGPVVRLGTDDLAALPDGVMIEQEGRACALRGGRLFLWTFGGYQAPREPGELCGEIALITPSSTVAALRKGYQPAWHPSASS